MCDEIFGSENRVEEVAWKNKYGSGALTKGFASVHEYLLVYAKQPIANIAAPLGDHQRKTYKNKDAKFPVRGGYITQPLATTSKDDRPNLRYPIHHEGAEIWPEKQWIWAEDRFKKAYDNDEIVINERDGKYSVRMKQYLRDENGVERLGKPISLLNGPFNQEGTKEIRELFGKTVFDFPKPSALIRYFFSFIVNDEPENDGIYLDFFSGSCASAHAVLTLNAQDGGQRRFIMVQLPEPCEASTEAAKAGLRTIADIGKERIRLVCQQIAAVQEQEAKEAGDKLPGTTTTAPELDLGFKVFKLDASNIKPWDADFDNLEDTLLNAVENIKPDRSEADVLYELLLKYGLDLAVPIEERQIDGKTVYIIGAGALVVCLGDKIALKVVEGIAALKEELKPEVMRVVFKDAGFADDVVKTNAVQILRQAEIEDVKSL
jgi:adenine-specific DNA-methyltransferase